jgi:demethylmenaquinone methyltransferase/2-methoxy-6-polyprenyl-1,4-benzoquinol methylase
MKSDNPAKFADPAAKKSYVRRMFDDISDRYDLLNRVLSFGMDVPWRRRTVRPHRDNKLVLDICSGTGDMAKELLNLDGFKGMIVLGDFAGEMHKLAQKKLPPRSHICYVNCDAENLPFKDGVFDGLVNGYSMRNLANLKQFGAEIRRVLSKGGQASLIDMAHPPNKFIAWLFGLYFYKFAPCISRLFTKKGYAYKYLPASLQLFVKQPEALANLRGETLEGSYENILGGMVAIYRLRKSR